MRSSPAIRWAIFAAVLAGAACRGGPSAGEASVKPGINADFLDPDLDVARYRQRFEGESREIFVHRARIAALAGVREGMHVADVGAGTGLFTFLFAPKVGAHGRVYAVEIAPRFVDHVRAVAAERGADNVVPVLCSERSVDLPEASVDLVFVCDTYHHFEYPQSTLASIRRALRPGGELFVVDFIRIPGRSRPWILDHVRAGQEEVTREIEAAGFVKVRDEDTPFLAENYAMRFVKAP
ncbi:MAG TPA: class I SAM-dependent methyltransferase [Planctomycetota bacterium]|nr:class I SAM-dependent methyltransferase [Planctomycetota bacterium]